MYKERKMLNTKIGRIATFHRPSESKNTALLFLHGVYFDHHLWDQVIQTIQDRTIITLDMPLHGDSKQISKVDWTLEDCADMLLEVMDQLQLGRVVAVGHSWGSMTILRAANQQPERFESVVLCNMPFRAVSKWKKRLIRLQHTLLVFRDFYTTQASKALFGQTTRKTNPTLIHHLQRTMRLLSNQEIKKVDKEVILEAKDSSHLIQQMSVAAIAIKGREDYVPVPPVLQTILVEGGHVSPLETPQEISKLISEFVA